MEKVKISWNVEIKGGVSLRLTTHDSKEFIIGPFEKIEDLEGEIDELCKGLRGALERVRDEWFLLTHREQLDEDNISDPQLFWDMLKEKSREEMVRLFNAQGVTLRKLVAQYVFENVSIFTGPGATFAELYNQETSLLEP
ncbi:MAG: hypothetical protein N2260_00270 [Syntrophobacterales bacterium]|nr:hypothetical protein [Syntrophobacterales bacterium]